jgi:hypothetical protein
MICDVPGEIDGMQAVNADKQHVLYLISILDRGRHAGGHGWCQWSCLFACTYERYEEWTDNTQQAVGRHGRPPFRRGDKETGTSGSFVACCVIRATGSSRRSNRRMDFVKTRARFGAGFPRRY